MLSFVVSTVSEKLIFGLISNMETINGYISLIQVLGTGTLYREKFCGLHGVN